MKIVINKETVYEYASALTARAALGTDQFSMTAINKSNHHVLDVYFSNGINLLEQSLIRQLSSSTLLDLVFIGDTAIIHVTGTPIDNPAFVHLAESSIRLYLAYYIAAAWLETTAGKDYCQSYATTADTHLSSAISAILLKKTYVVPEDDYVRRNPDEVEIRKAPPFCLIKPPYPNYAYPNHKHYAAKEAADE